MALVFLNMPLSALSGMHHMPPWETWFDSLGECWGMLCLFTFSGLVLLFVPSMVAGFLNSISIWRGFLGIFVCIIMGTFFMYCTHNYSRPGTFGVVAYSLGYVCLCFFYLAGTFVRQLTQRAKGTASNAAARRG